MSWPSLSAGHQPTKRRLAVPARRHDPMGAIEFHRSRWRTGQPPWVGLPRYGCWNMADERHGKSPLTRAISRLHLKRWAELVLEWPSAATSVIGTRGGEHLPCENPLTAIRFVPCTNSLVT